MSNIQKSIENTSFLPMTTPKTVYVSSKWSGDSLPRRNKMSSTYFSRLIESDQSAYVLFSRIIVRMRVNDKDSYLEAITTDITDVRALYPYRTNLNRMLRYLIDHNLLVKAHDNKHSHVYYVNPSVFHVMNRNQINDYCDAFDNSRLFGDVLL